MLVPKGTACESNYIYTSTKEDENNLGLLMSVDELKILPLKEMEEWEAVTVSWLMRFTDLINHFTGLEMTVDRCQWLNSLSKW